MVAVINPIPNLQTVYIAMYGRPADPQGLAYWNTITSNGTNLAPMVQFFAESPEFVSLFGPAFAPDAPLAPSTNDIQVAINQVYLQAFGREADVAGLNYWTAQIESGAVNATEFAMIIVQEAQAADLAVVNAKLGTADAFTASIDTTPELLTYPTESGLAAGRAFLAPVVSEATQPTQAQIDAALAAIASGEVTAGKTFTLTTGVDEFTGTAGNDTFQAEVGVSAETTITTFDNINGAGGFNTLNIVGAGVNGINAGAKFAAIQVVNIDVNAPMIDLNSASFGGVQQLWQIGTGIGDVTIGAGVVAGFRDGQVSSDKVIVADGVSSATVALDNVASASVITFAEDTAGDLTSVTVAGSLAANATTLDIDTRVNTTAVDTINLALASDADLSLVVDQSVLVTFNASTSTGDIVTSVYGFGALESLTLGSGADEIGASLDDDVDTTFVLGAGNDVMFLDGDGFGQPTALTTVTLGAGNDTFEIANGLPIAEISNISNAASSEFQKQLIVITDFDAVQDVIDVSNSGDRDTLTNPELSNIANATSLANAVALAATYTAGGDLSVFNYGGDAYVYANNGGAGFDAGDGLIKIVGLSVQEIDASNFIFA